MSTTQVRSSPSTGMGYLMLEELLTDALVQVTEEQAVAVY